MFSYCMDLNVGLTKGWIKKCACGEDANVQMYV